MSVQQCGKSLPPCRTCGGKKTMEVKAHTGGKVEVKTVPCPACRGTGTSGYITK